MIDRFQKVECYLSVQKLERCEMRGLLTLCDNSRSTSFEEYSPLNPHLKHYNLNLTVAQTAHSKSERVHTPTPTELELKCLSAAEHHLKVQPTLVPELLPLLRCSLAVWVQ